MKLKNIGWMAGGWGAGSRVAQISIFTGVCLLLPASGQLISKAAWSIASVSSQETVGEQAPASEAIDGNPASYWHSKWFDGVTPPPHEITVNLGALYSITQFQYLPRQDAPNGRIRSYQLSLSQNGTDWGQPVAEGVFVNSVSRQLVNIPSTPGRFLRVKILSNANDAPFSTIAELDLVGVLGAGGSNNAPDSIIDSIPDQVTVATGRSLTFAGLGLDVESNVPFTYAWNFGAGSGISPSTAQNPGAKQFNTTGQFQVSLAVTDSKGTTDLTPDLVSVNVTPDLLNSSTWALKFVDSQETVALDGKASNAFDGDPRTVWLSKGPSVGSPPPHELQIDLGAVHTVSGLQYIPRQASSAGRILNYVFYVSTDGVNWNQPVASGTLANSNLEQIVGFAPTVGRYVSFIASTDVGGAGLASIAELGLFGRLGTAGGSISTVLSANIIDASSAGQLLLTAPNAGAQRLALGLDGAGVKSFYETATGIVTQAEAVAGTSSLVRLWTPQRVAQAIAALAPVGTTPSPTKTFVLTIDAVANAMNYSIGRVSGLLGNFKVDEIAVVHVGANLSSPRVDVSILHSTQRNAVGTSLLPAVLAVTSATTGTMASGLSSLAAIPSGSWIWIKTSGLSGVTGNLEISISGKYTP